jgi:hypothetical protein
MDVVDAAAAVVTKHGCSGGCDRLIIDSSDDECGYFRQDCVLPRMTFE